MQIQKLKIWHFKSFYDTTILDFQDLPGLWRVTGSIGSGKTSLGEAILYGLYGQVQDKNNKSLISWGHKHATVELWVRSSNHDIYIYREINVYRQSPMRVEVDGSELISPDKRSTQEMLEDYLDIPQSVMELLCIISFNNFKSLSTLNAKDTKMFLDNVLGFDRLSQYSEAISSERSTIKDSLYKAQAEASALENQIQRRSSQVIVDGNAQEVGKIVQEDQAVLMKLQENQASAIHPLREEIKKLEARRQEVLSLGKMKKKEIDFIRQGKCPVCGAPIDSSQLEVKEREREVLLDQYSLIDKQIQEKINVLSQVQDDFSHQIQEASENLKRHRDWLSRLQEQEKIDGWRKKELEELESALVDCQSKIQRYQQDINEYDQLSTFFQSQIRQIILKSLVPVINQQILQICQFLSWSYIPEFDESFHCSIHQTREMVPISSLSTGQLKMVDMITILAMILSLASHVQSNIMFLDELFSNLDSRTRSDMLRLLRAMIPEGTTVFLVSHQDLESEMLDGTIHMTLESQRPSEGSSIYNTSHLTIVPSSSPAR